MNQITLSKKDRDHIFDLAHKLTGTAEVPTTRHEIVITNVIRRISAAGCKTFPQYLQYVAENEDEVSHLISAVTIHTTSWFRELPHYNKLEQNLFGNPSKFLGAKVRLLSAACSTGEELYSFGMVLESFRQQIPDFDYELVGFDIDAICVQKADAGYVQINDLNVIPESYRKFLISKSSSHYMIDPEIRKRTRFHVGNLLDPESFLHDPFDYIYCRNCLIYFSTEKVNKIISHLLSIMKPDGSLTLGHSESIDAQKFFLKPLSGATYRRIDEQITVPSKTKPITVLAIDDSSWTRLWLSTTLAAFGIKVITADSAESASELLERNNCDLITLEINLPGQNGLQWLSEQRRKGLKVPAIILTDVSTAKAPQILEALSGKSQDYVNKSQITQAPQEFIEKIQGLVSAQRHKQDKSARPTTYAEFAKTAGKTQLFYPDLILAGASTGGTEALCQLLAQLPPNCPPVVCVQHIPNEFAAAFLDRLAKTSGLLPGSPDKGKELQKGHIYLPVMDAHIGVKQSGEHLKAYYSFSEKVSNHRPSVDFLFQSAAHTHDKHILAFLLTGMGRDGAQGLLELKRIGAMTLAQDERSSIVWGMPGEAARLGAPLIMGNIPEMREVLFQSLQAPEKSKARKIS